MTMVETQKSLVEEREELMLSPSSARRPIFRKAIFRKAIFLKPSLKGAVAELPRQSPLPLTNLPPKVSFYQWRAPNTNFVTWVQKMAALHQQTWRKAGIFDAIMASTFEIHKDMDLVLGFVEKWCPDTKSFVFSWGEATITLEDVMILLGFPVLGRPVFGSFESDEMVGTRRKLEKARSEMNKTTYKKPHERIWMERFMAGDEEIEHEAFLALWLSRFVFPSSANVIVKDVSDMAVRLARGIRVALAPAVLASLYRDLRDLKGKLFALNEDRITFWSPFQLVQVWAWERFPGLRLEPNKIENGEPRLARWHKVKHRVDDVSQVLDSDKENFDWRPYVKPIDNWNAPKFYAEKGMWVSVGPDLNDEFLSFARCLRPSELVGMDCVEQYLPNRVGRQFGFDQDLPGYVARSNTSRLTAWNDFSNSISNSKLYIPSQHFQAGVSKRYLDWWNKSVSTMQVARKSPVKVQESSMSSTVASKKSKQTSKSGGESIDLTSLRSLKSQSDKPKQKCKAVILDAKKSSKLAQNLNRKKSFCSGKSYSMLFKSLKRKYDHVHTSHDGVSKSSKKLAVHQKERGNKVADSSISSIPKEPAPVLMANGVAKEGSTKASPMNEWPLNHVIQKELNNSPFTPRLPPKRDKARTSTEEDELTISEMWRARKKHDMAINIEDVGNGASSSCSCKRQISPHAVGQDNIIIAEIMRSSEEQHVSRGEEASNDKNPSGESDKLPASASKTVKDSVDDKVENPVQESPLQMNTKENNDGNSPCRYQRLLLSDSVKEDSLRIADLLKSNKQVHDVVNKNKEEGVGKNPSDRSQSLLASVANTFRDSGHLAATLREAMQSGAAENGSKTPLLQDAMTSDVGSQDEQPAHANVIKGQDSYSIEVPGLELEARINRLERIFAELLAAKYGYGVGSNS